MPDGRRHYLRQILDLADQLLETGLLPSQRNLAVSIQQAAISLQTSDSDMQRLEEMSPPGPPIDFDLLTLIHTLRDQVAGGHPFQCDFETALATGRRGDPESLRLVLRRLLLPVLTRGGSSPIELQVRAGCQSGHVLFDLRAESLSDDPCPKLLIERMGGSSSASGEKFVFEVPLPESDPPPRLDVQRRPIRGSQVLVVSQESDTLQRMLRDSGVLLVSEPWKPQAILLDETGAGPASAEHVRLWQARWPDCPIIVVVGSARRGDSEFYRELGCQAFLAQPVERAQLLEILGAVLAGRTREFLTSHRMREAAHSEATILVVEDNPTARMLTTRLVRRAGHVPVEAESGQQALELAASQSPEVILLDLSLGDMGGLEVARRLRAPGATTASIPIIAATAHSGEDIRASIQEAGIDDYLSKPFRFEELSRKLAQWAGKRILPPSPPPDVVALPAPAVDQEALRRAGMHDPAFEAELIQCFLAETEQILGQISQGSSEEARHLAHSLKGTASMLGVFKLAELAGRVEAENEPEKSSLIAVMEAEFRRAQSELRPQ